MRQLTFRATAASALLLAGCAPPTKPEPLPAGLAHAFESAGEIEDHAGLCDASAIAWIDNERFVVAGDEENFLRVFVLGNPLPLALVSLDDFLAVDREHPEADIEAVATVGETMFWLTSHGRNRNARPRPSRRRLFATRWNGATIETVGRPYDGLVADLLGDERFAVFALAEAARRAPKAPGGLNLEGLAVWRDGALLIGARNPIPDGLALLIPWTNPESVIHGEEPAQFGEPLRLDLDGHGVRSLVRIDDAGYLIAAGSAAGPADRVYFWSGEPDDPPLHAADLELNAEGMDFHPGEGGLIWLSDDGTRPVGGGPCKESADVADRSFRLRRSSWSPGILENSKKP